MFIKFSYTDKNSVSVEDIRVNVFMKFYNLIISDFHVGRWGGGGGRGRQKVN